MTLADYITPNTKVARSVNLERDMGTEVALRSYHLTSKGLEIISRFVAALKGERVNAWSLTGPYGMGKSSFANYLYALCGPEADEDTRLALRMLKAKDPTLKAELSDALVKWFTRKNGLFRVAVTASFESINRTLANGLRRAIQESINRSKGPRKGTAQLIAAANELCSQTTPDTTLIVDLFRNTQRVYGTPVALIIDELGKNLEFMARFPAQGDLFILQMLAESEGVFIWICLHQAFEEYTSRLSAKQAQEWGKIQGRFEDISFVEPKSEMVHFICETLARRNGDPHFARAVRSWAEALHGEAKSLGLPDLSALDVRTIERFYPLHPLVAVALPELCMRFAQNDRTLFAFLCSGEPAALPAFLGSETIDLASTTLPTFGLDRLYDYFLSSGSGTLMNRPESHRWIEIHDILERSRSVDPYHLSVLKTIGLLNLISGPSRFRSSEKLLAFAFLRPLSDSGANEPDLRAVIQTSIEKGVLTYREYADEYRLWEGTDFDIPAAVRERKALLATQSLEIVLNETLSLSPLTASKHSYVTGTLRHFERRWCSASQLAGGKAACSSREVDGLILYGFGNEPEPPDIPTATEEGLPIVLCYSSCEEQIRDLVLDAAAAKAVLRESPELAHDGVARKEARFRAQATEERLRSHLINLFSPGTSESIWYIRGEQRPISSHRDLSRRLSDCCDQTYLRSPVIRNELINRTRLSSAAARARRELMEAMVLNEHQPNLGLHGTGPEVAMYRTMLLAEGLHRNSDNEAWQFVAPEPDGHYFALWQALLAETERAGDNPIPVTDLIAMLRRPPFGLKEGPIPILLCLFLIVNSDELALYQEGAFIPSLGPEDMELMAKRPEYFTIKRFQQARIRGQVFQLYMSLLKAQPSSHGRQMRNETLISVVGPLVHFVKGLNPYVLHTKSVSRYAQNVRHVLQHARDPFDLLFVDLPRALELEPFQSPDEIIDEDLLNFRERFTRAISELRQAYPRLLERIKQVVLHAFGSDQDLAPLRGQLRQRAPNLAGRCGDLTLRPLLGTLTNFSGTDIEWLVSVATIVSQRPVDSWRESDLDSFAVRMRDFAGRFRALETLIARTESVLPTANDGRQPRLVSLTDAEGKISSSIVWKNDAAVQKAEGAVEKLIRDHGMDRSALETILVLLSEKLLSEQAEAEEEAKNG